ncbi:MULTISPECIES: hypothetical protein [Cupriavidus]
MRRIADAPEFAFEDSRACTRAARSHRDPAWDIPECGALPERVPVRCGRHEFVFLFRKILHSAARQKPIRNEV